MEILSNINWDEVSSLEWQVENSDDQSILFYNLGSGDLAQFLKRISIAKFKICFVQSEKDFNRKDVISLNKDEWLSVREMALDKVYPLPEKTFMGVTGTNGKSTVTDLVRQLCVLNKRRVLTIGTLGVYLNDKKVEDFKLTTPDYIDIRKTLHNYKFDIFCIEMSSHALDQKRFGKLRFDVIGWTSFSQDHLDYHKNMEDYFLAKMKCFCYLKEGGRVFVPADQKSLFDKINDDRKVSAESFKSSQSDFLKVAYNQENMGLALAMLEFAGEHVEKKGPIESVPGRFNLISFKDCYVVIDFAHTPDALKSLGSEIKKSFPDHDIITLFGCGGDRDRQKRPLMGKAASDFSISVIVTSDNPRTENPLDILNDIKPGIHIDADFEVDRKKAIGLGIDRLDSKKILLVAGKGHENYIEINGVRHPFSDEQEVRSFINDKLK